MHCTRCLLNSVIRNYGTSGVPKIVLPVTLTEKRLKLRAKELHKEYQENRRYKGPVVISCKRTKFNHYKGQRYSDFSYNYLASGGWKNHKSVGDHFSINAHAGNPALQLNGEASLYKDFGMFGLDPNLVHGLSEHGIIQPTNIQALAIPSMMRGSNVMCCAETGSGKTLAYLLPLLHKIKQYKEMHDTPAINSPYAIIITPSRELADQIYTVAKDLANYVGCKPHILCGGRGTQKIMRHRPEDEMDLLVTTPGVLSKILTMVIYNQARLMHVILDEADTLLDDSFNTLTLRLLQKLKLTSEKMTSPGTMNDQEFGGTQLALVSATMPTNMKQILGDIVPVDTVEQITTSNIHTLMPHVTQRFIRVSGESKPEEFLKIIKSSKDVPTIVFCKTSQTANFVGYLLEDEKINNVVMHANMQQKVRNGRFDMLLSGQTNILVATDIASRGLDTTRVHRVINYDFPLYMSDYIHRAGRVGRVGSAGTGIVISFIQQKWEVGLLWKIETSARRMTKLRSVNANIKRTRTNIINVKYNKELLDGDDPKLALKM